MISFQQKGDFKNTSKFLAKLMGRTIIDDLLDQYGRDGVAALKAATPVDTGNTAESWEYRVERKSHSISIVFYNTNIQNGVPIAILLQYGHATGNGGYVQGRDYINPAIRPIFDRLAKVAWEEVTKV